MIKIEDFAKFKSNGRTYGGHKCFKKGILINDEDWFIKYPKSTKSMEVQGLSYTTSPLSEYIGSHIYETLGVLTHETKLGILDGKVVVACKDFTAKNEILVDYNSLKNNPDLMSPELIDSIITENDKNFNALDYIKKMTNESLNEAIIRIVPKINLEKIKEIINGIPEYFADVIVYA